MSKAVFEDLARTLPAPAAKRISLRVVPQAERSIRNGHPWLYSNSIEEQGHEGAPGDVGVVFDRKRRFLAIGLYDPTSPIRLRVLHHGDPIKIDDAFFASRLAAAAEKRKVFADPARPLTDGYRLVNGESDGFPGLVVDRYADTLVAKLYTPAWIPHLASIVAGLRAVRPHERLVLRLNRAMQKTPDFLHGLKDGQILHGPELSGPVVFSENGLRFEAEPVVGQKTGFFLDQRDNRARVEAISRDQDVLNVFSYTGGFTVYAARGGALSVTSVDISSPAMDATDRNLALNKSDRNVARCRHDAVVQDAFAALEEMASQERRFGVVILDPPMFAQSSAQVGAALSNYQRLTRLGLELLEPGGTLVQASCSNRVPAETFFQAVEDAARAFRRPLTEIRCTGHAADHPVAFEGGSYLKCIFARA